MFLSISLGILVAVIFWEWENISQSKHQIPFLLIAMYIATFGGILIITRSKLRSLAIVVIAVVLHYLSYKLASLHSEYAPTSSVYISFWAGFFPIFVLVSLLLVRNVYGAILIFTTLIFFTGYSLVWEAPQGYGGPKGTYTVDVEGDCRTILKQDVGFVLKPNCYRRLIRRYASGDTITAHVNTDHYSRRIVGDFGGKDDETLILAIGGSRTWGDSVSNNETYPHWLGKRLAKSVHVYAFSSWSPAQIVGMFSRESFWEDQVGDRDVIVVYLAIPGHVRRVSGAFATTLLYHPNYPKYEIDGTQTKYLGTLQNYSYWKFMVFPALAKFLGRYNRFIADVGRSKEDYLNHLRWIVSKVREKKSKYEAYLVVHPGKMGADFLDEFSLDTLTNTGFTVIDASTLFDISDPYVIDEQVDTHLSPIGNELLGTFIAKQVKIKSTILK